MTSTRSSFLTPRRLLGAGIGIASLVLLSVIIWLKTDHEASAVTEACLKEVEARGELALLAVRSMTAFGRIDPGLYLADQEDGKIRLNPDVFDEIERGASEKGGQDVERVEQSLRSINDRDAVRQLFIEAHERAIAACGATGCPREKYSIRVVEAADRSATEGEHLYQFTVEGKGPSSQAWKDGFLTQYASNVPPPGCPLLAPLQLDEPKQDDPGTPKSAGLAPTPDETATPPADAVQTKKLALMPDIERGYAAYGLVCAAVSYKPCKQDCTTASGNPGKYKQSGPPTQMCCYSSCQK